MFKGLVTGLLLGASALFAQEKPKENKQLYIFHPDSAITYSLEDIIVEAKKQVSEIPEVNATGLATLYFNDANKMLMSQKSGIFTVIPLYSRLRITNMDPSLIVLLYLDMPLLLDNTLLHGGLSIINSQMSELGLEKTAYSAKYSSIGSVMEIFPRDYPNIPTVLLSMDFIEKNVLFSTNLKLFGMDVRTTNAFRNIGVPKPLENIVTSLRILPDIYELASNTEFSNDEREIEFFIRSAFDKGDFYDEKDAIKLKEDAANHFILARYTHVINDGLKASIKVSHENNNNLIDYNFLDDADNLRVYTRNTAIGLSLDNNPFSMGARIFFLTNGTSESYQNKQVNDVFAEYKYVMGKVLLEPSIRVMNSGKIFRTSQALRATYYIDNTSFGVAYGHPVNMLVTNSSSAENVLTLDRLGDQYADHYTAFLYIVPEDYIKGISSIIHDIDVSLYLKDFISGSDKGRVQGLDMMIRNDSLKIWDGFAVNYAVKYSLGDAKLNDKGMPGSIKEILNIDVGLKLSEAWFLNSQFTSHSGYLVKNKLTNTLDITGKANYLSVGLTYMFELFGSKVSASATMFNILRLLGNNDTPEFVRYKIGDKTKGIKLPPFGDVRFNVNVVF